MSIQTCPHCGVRKMRDTPDFFDCGTPVDAPNRQSEDCRWICVALRQLERQRESLAKKN